MLHDLDFRYLVPGPSSPRADIVPSQGGKNHNPPNGFSMLFPDSDWCWICPCYLLFVIRSYKL